MVKLVYLFLDFDGVLHHFFPLYGESDERNAKFAFLSNFEKAVRESPVEVRIVISSTWRRDRSLEELRAFFSEDIAPLIVGSTPFLNGSHNPGGRLREVLTWLKEHNLEDAPWVGIDDFTEGYDPTTLNTEVEPALVWCHDQFEDREAQLLLKAIQDPKAFALENPCPRTNAFEEKRIISVSLQK